MVVLTFAAAAEPEITVVGDAPDPAAAGARVTVVDPTSLPASADVATAAQRSPGVVVRRLGGLGDPAEVGIRGAGARHTEVWLDGVPLNPEGAGAFDVSDLPLAAFERVEILRGASPSGTGVPAIGGAVWLSSRRSPVEEVGLTLGTSATSRATLAEGTGPALLVVDGLSSSGRFRWWDAAGTPDVPRDDHLSVRENNATRHVSTLARADVGAVSLLHAATIREDGVPGFVNAPTDAVTYTLHRELAGVSGRRELGANVVTAGAWGVLREEGLRDPRGEIALGAEDEATALRSGGASVGLAAPLTGHVRAEVSAAGRVDGSTTTDRRTGATTPGRTRAVGRMQLAAPVSAGDLAVLPTLQVLSVSAPGTWLVLPRAGARYVTGPAVWSATGGLAGRPPDPIELFGDRGAQIGNPDLRPERGRSLDLGVGLEGPARLELVGFVTAVTDLIVWIPTPQGVARPENVAGANLSGLELSASTDGAPGGVLLAATALNARQQSDDPTYDGRFLPRVPAAEVFGAGHAALGPLDLGADASFTAGTWEDSANLRAEAPRVLLGATARLTPAPHWRLELDVRNALGTRTARVPRDPLVDDGVTVPRPLEDFGGYPLPGRRVTCSLRWSR